MRRLVHPLLSLAVALGLGAGAAVLVHRHLDSSADREYAAGDRVLAAVEGLRDDRVHVTADGRAFLDEEGEAVIARTLAERDLPVYVLVWEDSWFAGYDHYVEAAEQVLHLLEEPGLLVLWQGTDTSTTQASEGYRVSPSVAAPQPDYLGDPMLRITEWLDQMPDEPLVPVDWDYYGGRVGGFFAGLLYGLPVVLGAWVLVGLIRLATGRRFRNRPART
jgi:hypothetical protein